MCFVLLRVQTYIITAKYFSYEKKQMFYVCVCVCMCVQSFDAIR